MTYRDLRRFVASALAGLTIGLVAATAMPALAHGFYDQCNTNTAYSLGIWTRSQARSFALVGRYEGYHWGGGCWDNDNVDDQPGDPVQTEGTHGEGGDCSGFTFKSWGLKNSETTSGYHYWPRMHRVHGPFVAAEFKAGLGPDVNTVAKPSAIYMDAFASSGHIGMIYSTTSTANTDNIIEAKSEASGTGLWSRTYRGDGAYGGVRRGGGCGWDGTCS